MPAAVIATMTEFLLAVAAFVLATVALGLVRVLRGPANADRMMAPQLLGTGGIAAFASVAFVQGASEPAEPEPDEVGGG
jgi:multicomponent Na+:H+ antiporter subunit F